MHKLKMVIFHENQRNSKEKKKHNIGKSYGKTRGSKIIIIIIIISIYIALNRLILHSALQCLLYD